MMEWDWISSKKLALDYEETWPQGTELYHVAPARASESIRQNGLIGAEHPSHSPWPYAKEDWYEQGNYLFISYEAAEDYQMNVAQMARSPYVIVTIDGSGLTSYADPENVGSYDDWYAEYSDETNEDYSYWDWLDERREYSQGFDWARVFAPEPIGPERILDISQPYRTLPAENV